MAPNIEEEKLIAVDEVEATVVKVGVLAIQGAFAEHIRALNRVAEQLDKERIRYMSFN